MSDVRILFYRNLELALVAHGKEIALDKIRKWNSPHTMKNAECEFIRFVKASIEEEGMRNPLTIEWYDFDGGVKWAVRTGHNRAASLILLGIEHAKAIVLCPDGVEPPPGDYVELTPEMALCEFGDEQTAYDSELLTDLIKESRNVEG